ncbi:MAG TPA: response regulator [Verrucomicrobiota bacterium]|nr:response regulator [Verrucomicrobiota bacterium]HQL79091.1 response regulator [Verrucomicrobiota bacterium]
MEPSPTTPPAAAPRPVRILVAEDSPLNQQVALKQLEKLGYQAEGVADGTGAVEALRQTPYDVILMDCQMPELNGYEATWQIRDSEKQQAAAAGVTRRVYIIAMTANTKADNRDKCLQAGMDDFIRKPVQLPELEAALHRALADRASQKALDKVIDPVVIAGLHQLRTPGKPDPLAEIIDLFLQEAPAHLQALESAVAQNDHTSLARTFSAAVRLKGSAMNLGARNLAALCDEIEQTARNWSLADDVPPLLEQARRELDRVREALEKIRSGQEEEG